MSRSVVDQASDVGGVVAAARMREKFLRQRVNASTDEEREGLSDAIGTLEVRFPDLEDLPAGGAERFAKERGHGTGKRTPTHEGRRRPGKPDAEPLERAANKAGSPRRSSPATRDASPRARGDASPGSDRDRTVAARSRNPSRGPIERRARSRLGQGYRETGIPLAGASASSIVMSTLGATVGLAAVYLLLSPNGSKATSTALDLIGGFLQRIIAPVDIFGKGLTPTQAAAAENPGGTAAARVRTSASPTRPGSAWAGGALTTLPHLLSNPPRPKK